VKRITTWNGSGVDNSLIKSVISSKLGYKGIVDSQTLEINKSYINEVLKGMESVTGDAGGTAYSTFADFPVKVAGKTGTVQVPGHYKNGVLRYFAALKDISTSEADKRIDFWLDRMGLAEWKHKRTNDLSKGMQQKIQFISTVLHDPDLLILDEPFSGLDPVNVEFMIEVLSEFRTGDKTVMFSTHQMETAERLCSDILLINKAKKVIGGSLRQVKESYGKNLIALRVTGENGILQDRSLVKRAEQHADEIEVELADGADDQALLKKLVESGARVSKFEKIEPSLNDIFIDVVGGER
jgi:ABC-type uncharacterized transport system ATPase subunit